MAKYNCIIKELPVGGQGRTKILGRIFLQDLSQIPAGWEVKLRGSSISRDTDLEKLMCTSTNPLVIYKKSAPAANTLSDEQLVTARNTLHSLNVAMQVMNFLEPFLFQKPEEIPIVEGQMGGPIPPARSQMDAPIPIAHNEMGEDIFSTQSNIDAGPIDGVGVETNHFWKSYKHGMNLVGECPNMECDSRKGAESDEGRAFYNNGYGEIYLPDDMYKFNCPACGDSLFHISNFVLSCGRALFQYKKGGTNSETKEVILESNGPFEEYKTFETQADQPLTDYDFVLIMTVASNQSFYYCKACDESIDEVEDEEMLSCGHSYHKSTCSPNSAIGCIVCKSKPLESISFLMSVGNS